MLFNTSKTGSWSDEVSDIYAVKKDNSMVKLATTELNPLGTEMNNLVYSDGKLYFIYDYNYFGSIDLTKGNGNYEIKEYII